MIAPDIKAALMLMETACRNARQEGNHLAVMKAMTQLAHGLQVIREAAERVEHLEAQTVPTHWRPQWLNPAELPPNVVPLRQPRGAAMHGGAA